MLKPSISQEEARSVTHGNAPLPILGPVTDLSPVRPLRLIRQNSPSGERVPA